MLTEKIEHQKEMRNTTFATTNNFSLAKCTIMRRKGDQNNRVIRANKQLSQVMADTKRNQK